MTDDSHLLSPEAQHDAALAQAAAGARRASNLPHGKSAHLDDDTPAGRIALFLDGREAMLSSDPERIATVCSIATDGRLVDLVPADLRHVLAERNDPAAQLIRLVATALAADGEPDYRPADAVAAQLSAEDAEQLLIALDVAAVTLIRAKEAQQP